MRYFIFFGYDGTNYHGWQIQPNANSVQQELQRALSILLRKEIEVVGAGRTDTGVHARNMAAHFDWNPEEKVSEENVSEERIPMALDQLVYRLNRILPRDIAVYEVREVDAEMHARFSATSRTYHYYIHTRKDPFERHYSLQMNYPLDFEKMNQAAQHFLHHEDYAAFVLNIVMTFPLGVYLYLFNYRMPFERVILAGFCFSLFIESNQFIWDYFLNLQRLADVDDLITNTLGAIIGFSLMIILYQNGWQKFLQRFMII